MQSLGLAVRIAVFLLMPFETLVCFYEATPSGFYFSSVKSVRHTALMIFGLMKRPVISQLENLA